MSTSTPHESARPTEREPQRTHSGEGRFVENVITFAVMFVVFLVGLYLIGFVDHNDMASWWAMPAAIVVMSLVYFVGFSRPTRKEHAGR